MRLSFVKFTDAVRDPSAPGLFERQIFCAGNSKSTLERRADGAIAITAPSGDVIVTTVPYWCVEAPGEPVAAFAPADEPVTVVERRTPSIPPVAQPQGHPRDKNKNLGKIQRKGE